MGSLVHGSSSYVGRSGFWTGIAFLWAVVASAAQVTTPKPVLVVLETEKGAIEIEVDVARAPGTSANFLKYVDGGYYNGGVFHRTVRPDTEPNKEFPIQVIQARRARGDGVPPGFPPIPLERTNVTGIEHTDGAVSMARSTAADSASNEFFICIGNQPELDFAGKRNADGQGFGAFGRVVRGMDVVKAIQASPVTPAVGRGGTPPPLPNSQTLQPPIKILKAYRR
jgi:peptidyl-prolyl cis-trans isomerase A (cyclophilin A)